MKYLRMVIWAIINVCLRLIGLTSFAMLVGLVAECDERGGDFDEEVRTKYTKGWDILLSKFSKD